MLLIIHFERPSQNILFRVNHTSKVIRSPIQSFSAKTNAKSTSSLGFPGFFFGWGSPADPSALGSAASEGSAATEGSGAALAEGGTCASAGVFGADLAFTAVVFALGALFRFGLLPFSSASSSTSSGVLLRDAAFNTWPNDQTWQIYIPGHLNEIKWQDMQHVFRYYQLIDCRMTCLRLRLCGGKVCGIIPRSKALRQGHHLICQAAIDSDPTR